MKRRRSQSGAPLSPLSPASSDSISAGTSSSSFSSLTLHASIDLTGPDDVLEDVVANQAKRQRKEVAAVTKKTGASAASVYHPLVIGDDDDEFDMEFNSSDEELLWTGPFASPLSAPFSTAQSSAISASTPLLLASSSAPSQLLQSLPPQPPLEEQTPVPLPFTEEDSQVSLDQHLKKFAHTPTRTLPSSLTRSSQSTRDLPSQEGGNPKPAEGGKGTHDSRVDRSGGENLRPVMSDLAPSADLTVVAAALTKKTDVASNLTEETGGGVPQPPKHLSDEQLALVDLVENGKVRPPASSPSFFVLHFTPGPSFHLRASFSLGVPERASRSC